MKITSKWMKEPPPGLTSITKVHSPNSTYEPAEMNDITVYQFAQTYWTVHMIAEFFQVSPSTVLDLHGDAFRKGKAYHSTKPAILHDIMTTQIMNAAQADPAFFSDPKNSSVGSLGVQLMQTKWKYIDGLGQKQEITVTDKRPVNAGDFKFHPLTVENKDEPWTEGTEE